MDITIQRLPDGRLQAYGEDLEHMRECIVGDAESVADRLAEVWDDAMPCEVPWTPEPGLQNQFGASPQWVKNLVYSAHFHEPD